MKLPFIMATLFISGILIINKKRSFGLQVAALTGVPKAVIADACRTLAELGNTHVKKVHGTLQVPCTESGNSSLYA